MSLKRQLPYSGFFDCHNFWCLSDWFLLYTLFLYSFELLHWSRIATQIASGVESGAVDPFAGVSLMEEYIKDANRLFQFF